MSIVAGQALADPTHQNLFKNQENGDFDYTKRKNQRNRDKGGWSFFQSLCNNNDGIVRNRGDSYECTDKVYVPPPVKLTDKSLEMCTENLGCESGSESSCGGDDISLLAMEATAPLISPPKPSEDKKLMRISRSACNSFPPPLKSASGSNYGQIIKSYREEGRLVLRTMRVSSPRSCFVADRSDGRLRLCFVGDDSSLSFDDEEEHEDTEYNAEEEQEEEEEEEEDDEAEAFREEEAEKKKVDEEETKEDIEENNENFEGKIRTKKFKTPRRRCKENGHEQKALLNWKQQFCMAT